MNLICKNCSENWELVGRSYKRKDSNKIDYFCLSCKSKLKPIRPKRYKEKEYNLDTISINSIEGKNNGILINNFVQPEYINAKQDLGDSITTYGPIKENLLWYEKPRDDVDWGKVIDEPIKKDLKNLLIVGDLHEPFTLKGYLEFCYNIYLKYNCTYVIFMGDIIDNHYPSFHATDPDGLSAKDELDFAISKIKKWSDKFPIADVCLGNHDLLILRKSYKEGVSKRWIKDFNEVLGVKWDFKPSFEYNKTLFRHGLGMKASPKAGSEMMNVVQGHFHIESYIHYRVGRGKMVFGAQCPCGVDRESYAMAYAKEFPKQAIGCMTITNYGKTPTIHMMEL